MKARQEMNTVGSLLGLYKIRCSDLGREEREKEGAVLLSSVVISC